MYLKDEYTLLTSFAMELCLTNYFARSGPYSEFFELVML